MRCTRVAVHRTQYEKIPAMHDPHNRPLPASVIGKSIDSREGSEKPQGRRVGSRVDPARGLVHKSIRNVEAGSSGCRQHRTARHGQRTLKGTKPQGRRLLSFGRQRRRDAISDPLARRVPLNWKTGRRCRVDSWYSFKSGRESHAAAQRHEVRDVVIEATGIGE